MSTRRLKHIVFFLAGISLYACKIIQHYETPPLPVNALYRSSQPPDSNTLAHLKWSSLFTDPLLQTLIDSGIANNPNLKAAITRIEQSRAYLLQSRAAFFPTVNANAGVTASKLSEAQGFGIRNNATQYELGLSSSWEADLWGRLRSSRRAAQASLLQTTAGARAVQTALVADIANLYFLLLALDKQLDITNQTVYNWDTTVQTMRLLKRSARVTEAAVVQSEAQRYAAAVTIPDLKQNIRETENALSILPGRVPDAITRSRLDNQQIDSMLQTGVPAQLLSYRPDVMQAEQNYRYYFELTNVARTYFYPSLNITGSAGLASLNSPDLFNTAAVAASIGASLTQPIYNRRANRTRLEVAHAQQREALFTFHATLLNAGREVSDALFLFEAAVEKLRV